MRDHDLRSIGVTAIWLALAVALPACNDDTILVSPVVSENRAPRIVAQWPPIGSEPLILRAFDSAPEFHVIVSDPDGAAALAAVYLEYDSLIVNRLIARPALQEDGCRRVFYADLDTLDIGGVFPNALPGVSFVAMANAGNGLFVSPAFCTGSFRPSAPECELFPPLNSYSIDFGIVPCIEETEWLWAFIMFPPSVESQRTVFITEADLVYAGVRVIVFDNGGLSDTAAFGDLRIIHTTDSERRVAP